MFVRSGCLRHCLHFTFIPFIAGTILFIVLYSHQQTEVSNIGKASDKIFPLLAVENCLSDAWAVSTCGCRSDRRGYHQKIISYSLYGNFSHRIIFSRYVKAMERISNQVRLSYPDWIVRIYSTAENSRILEKIFWNHKHIDICVIESVLDESRPQLRRANQLFPTVWRFLPLLDPMVDLFMSRDSDSYIIEREIEAVKEWLNSSFAFHVMRDHQLHCKLLFCTYTLKNGRKNIVKCSLSVEMK